MVDGNGNAADNKGKWIKAFQDRKNLLSGSRIEGITTSTSDEDGYAKLKKWCTYALSLSFNRERKTVFTSASSWCIPSIQ